jgi:hypothetical protein
VLGAAPEVVDVVLSRYDAALVGAARLVDQITASA